MRFPGSGLAAPLAAIGILLAGWAPAQAAAAGEFLFLHNSGGGMGGIWGVDVTGTNFFGMQPGTGAGFATTTPPYPNPQVVEFWQARNNGRIAFGSTMNPSDSERIYVINGDGSGLRQVTFHDPNASTNWHGFPSISPDGSKIAYVNNETIAPPGTHSGNNVDCSGHQYAALWLANSDGSNPHLVRGANWGAVSYCNTGNPWGAAAWSSDNTRLVVKDQFGDPNTGCLNEMVVMHADGSNAQPINCNNNWGQPTLGLDWSPDGTKLAAIVACGGGGQEVSCWVLNIYNTSNWSVASSFTTFAGVPMNNYVVRFSPDSSLLALYDNNDQTIHIGDLSGNSVANVSVSGQGAQPGQLWWNSSSPGVLSSMTLGVPSVYVNACPNYTVQLWPSTFNTNGGLVNHGYTGVNGSINSGDGDSWHVDGFGNAYFNQTRGSATGTLQLSNFGVSSNTVPLTADSTCSCQTRGIAGLTVARGGLRYVASAGQQFVQTVMVTNNSGNVIAGPINVAIQNLTPTVTLTNASGTTGCASPGSPYMTVVQPDGSLGAGQSAAVQLYFRDPSLGGFTYSTTVTSGAGAP
jgi:hypothetical protein